jgi:hypothetical protein
VSQLQSAKEGNILRLANQRTESRPWSILPTVKNLESDFNGLTGRGIPAHPQAISCFPTYDRAELVP